MTDLEAVADPRLPEVLRQRLPAAAAHATSQAEAMTAQLGRQQPAINRRLTALARPGPREPRLRELRRIAEVVSQTIAPFSACRAGCAHCCHIPVTLAQSEARLIGRAIGRPPVEWPLGTVRRRTAYGYDDPCPFLHNQRCSIYSVRPLACRAHFNLDRDDLLCRLLPKVVVPVPYADLGVLHQAYIVLTQREALADIRDYFPPGQSGPLAAGELPMTATAPEDKPGV